MAEKMIVIPRAGLVVRDPVTLQPLPETGAEVSCSAYWLRRVADGDVSKPAPASKSKSHSGKAGPAKE